MLSPILHNESRQIIVTFLYRILNFTVVAPPPAGDPSSLVGLLTLLTHDMILHLVSSHHITSQSI